MNIRNENRRFKKLLVLMLIFSMMFSAAACGSENDASKDGNTSWEKVTVTDQAGREVTIESRPEKIVSGYYISTSILLALDCKERLVGIEAKAKERNIYTLAAPEIIDLPNTGSAKDFNLEACIALEPDLVVLPKKLQEPARALEEMGIPVLLISPEDDQLLEEAISMIAAAVGEGERAEALLHYYDEVNEKLQEKGKEEDAPIIYLAGNSDMLRTCPADMYQNTLIEAAKGKNAAAEIKGDSWAGVSYEQLLAWDPDYIVIVPEASYTAEDLCAVPELANLTAVKEGKVLTMPSDFEAWDSPVPSGALGKLWLFAALHPEAYSLDELREDVADFYQRFYGFEADKELVTLS